jgi:hypothetical protein
LTTLYGPPSVVQGQEDLKLGFQLGINYPNPFNPETRIRYQLPFASVVVLRVYDALGRRVRTLVNQIQLSGYYEAAWDGKDDHGQPSTSGIYLYTIQAGECFDRKMMLLLK